MIKRNIYFVIAVFDRSGSDKGYSPTHPCPPMQTLTAIVDKRDFKSPSIEFRARDEDIIFKDKDKLTIVPDRPTALLANQQS